LYVEDIVGLLSIPGATLMTTYVIGYVDYTDNGKMSTDIVVVGEGHSSNRSGRTLLPSTRG
jgi:hypothetical protein